MSSFIRTDPHPVFYNIVSLMLVLATLVAIGIFNVEERHNPEHSAVKAVTAFVTGIRDRSIRSGGSYRISAVSPDRMVVSWAANCATEKRIIKSDLSLDLPSGVVFTDPSWQLCFNESGNSSGASEITIKRGGHIRRIIIGPGSSVRAR